MTPQTDEKDLRESPTIETISRIPQNFHLKNIVTMIAANFHRRTPTAIAQVSKCEWVEESEDSRQPAVMLTSGSTLLLNSRLVFSSLSVAFMWSSRRTDDVSTSCQRCSSTS